MPRSKQDFLTNVPLSRSEKRCQAVIRYRKELGLTFSDLTVFLYLVIKGQRKMMTRRTPADLAYDLGVNERQMYATIQKLKELDIIRLVEYEGIKYMMVSPLIVSCGNQQKRAFKAYLWNNAIQSKRKTEIPDDVKNAIHDEVQE